MSLTTRTDVTAVKFYKTFILAGIGSYVNVFDKQTTKLMRRIQCLNGQKIHGFVISKCGKRVLVFGGKQFTELLIEASNEVLVSRCFDSVLCDDWIHVAIWIDNDEIALLTAHNVVQKWNTTNQTMLSHHLSSDNSILYSGLLLPMQDDLIVFAGTVYSEVIIHRCGKDRALHRLKGHRGVIFSISCHLLKQIIVTTSDDRSVRIWALKNPEKVAHNTTDFWNKIQIECSHEVYGHVARVMRNLIINEFVVSCGEDAAICFWTLDGQFIRKVVSHQTSTVWSIDANDNQLVTGGGDSGIMLHPLTVATDYYQKYKLDIDGTIKKVQFTSRNNLVLVNADELIYYDVKTKLKMPHKLLHQSTYKMLSLSSCKQLVAVADMTGDLKVYLENCKDDAYLQMVIDTKIDIDRLMSLHWAGNRLLVACSDDGDITALAAKGNETETYSKFKLPPCREQYITAATINPINNMIICGDRSGNVHCFVKGQVDPVKTFKNVHGSYGPTSITVRDNVIVSTGRLGNIAYHSLEESKYLTEKSVECQWIEKFLDKDENMVCGFQEKKFVVYNVKGNTKILEVPCGGGHRPWDAIRYFEQVDSIFEEFIRLIYVKNNIVYLVTAQLSKIVSKAVVNGSHSKIIHCLETYKSDLDSTITYYISGGEDTIMRISSMNTDLEYKDEYVYKHLSNIRCLKIFPMEDNRLLVMSAGGRAQLCINMFKFEICDGRTKISCQEIASFMLRGDDEHRRLLRKADQEYDFNPETRMMDIDAIRLGQDKFIIIIGCSDTLLRIYSLEKTTKDMQLNQIKEIEFHTACILKTVYIKFQDKDLVVTATTRGDMAFWIVINEENKFDIVSFMNNLNVSNSGTNSIDFKVLEDKLVIAVGGDNNAISMLLLVIEPPISKTEKHTLEVIDQIKMDNLYCSQITGLVLLDDVMISTSIDQRVTVCEWRVVEDKIECTFLTQTYTDVADVAGLHLLEHSSDSATVCVFGKGFEVLQLDLTHPKKKNLV